MRLCERALANEFPSFPLSHHPNCARFRSHTINLGRYRFCIGCYIGYPSALTGLVAGTVLLLQGIVPPWGLFGFGMAGYLSFLASLGKFSELKSIKILQKIGIGMGSGFILVFGFCLFDVLIIIKILVATLFLLGLLLPIRTVHLRKATKICASCESRGKDPDCSLGD